MAKVSVAILTYNRKEYLRDCLKSVLNQVFTDFLVYIFDNCSDYDLETFLKNFNDKRIILERSEKNLGEQGNYERVFNYNFPSEYLIIFHDDDTMHPLLLEKEVKLLDKYPDMVFVGTGLKFIKDHNKMFSFDKINNEKNFYICQKSTDLVRLILKDFDLSYSSVMFRKNFVNIIAKITKDFYHYKFFKWSDRPYLIELTKRGKVGIIKEKLINYRIHPSQDSQLEARDKSEYLFNLFLYYKDQLPQPLSKKDQRLFYSFCTNNLIQGGLFFSQNIKEYYDFLQKAKSYGLFFPRYLNIRGLFYFLKAIKYFLKKNN